MSGSCIEKIAHSKCGSSDALQVFENEGNYTGYCFNCATYVANPYNDRDRNYKPTKITPTTEQIQAEIAEIETLPYLGLELRKLEKETLEYFGIRTAVSEEDGHTPVATYSPYYSNASNSIPSGYKVNILSPKTFFIVGNIKDTNLFGWKQAIKTGAKKLFITEGEKDAPSLWQALRLKQKGTQYENAIPAVVSVSYGAGSAAKEILKHSKAIRHYFKEVVLVFDQDQAGKEAVEAVLRIMPEAKVAIIPGKDPNDCLVNGHAIALANAALFQASTPKNTRVVQASTLFHLAKKPAEYGLSWPWEGLTKSTRGIREGETIYLGAAQKMGKSEMKSSIGAHMIKEHGQHVFMACPEEDNIKTIKLLASKMVGHVFHDPDMEFDEDAFDRACSLMGDKLHLLDIYQELGWKNLKHDIVKAVSDGCKSVFIDPITNLTNGIGAAEANTVLQEFAQEISIMAKDLKFTAFLFCHLRNPDNGPPHERGGAVMSHQFAGSRAMARSCNLMLGLEGNKSPELEPEQRNMRKLVILEDREFGSSGYIPLYWNPKTSYFTEIQEN